MKLHWHRIGMMFALGVLSLALLAACSSESESDDTMTETPATGTPAAETMAESTVAVTLSEWDIVAEPATAAAGDVTFNVENVGAIPHEMVIIRTDLAEDALTVVDGVVDLAELDVVDEIEEFAGGTTESGTFALEAGNYVLICDIPAHYGQGMHATLTVE